MESWKNWKVLTILVVAILLGIRGYMFLSGGMVVSPDVPSLSYTAELYETTDISDVWKIKYPSSGTEIYGLLSIPRDSGPGKMPAFVLLPANSIPKEDEHKWAGTLLNEMGFVTLSLDQRGHGETRAEVRSIEQDIQYYVNGRDTVQHLMVEDALNAFEILKLRPEVDESRIYMLGESMGGRFAIMSAAGEPDVAGVVVISSSGYGFPETGRPEVDEFLYSIDPDNFIDDISPRNLLMIHATEDSVIPIDKAKDTFSRAGTPKKFFELNASFHGFLKEGTGIEDVLRQELSGW